MERKIRKGEKGRGGEESGKEEEEGERRGRGKGGWKEGKVERRIEGGTGGSGWKEMKEREQGGSKTMQSNSNLLTSVKLQWGPYPWFPSCVHHHHSPIISGAP